MVALSERFSEALAFATRVHAGQLRKGTSVPYVSHVLAVCALVLEDGGGEDEAIAALLHDAVEDGGGRSDPAGLPGPGRGAVGKLQRQRGRDVDRWSRSWSGWCRSSRGWSPVGRRPRGRTAST